MLLAVLCGISASALCGQSAEIRVLTEEWAPYNYIENDRIAGLSVEIVQELLSRLEMRQDIQLLPGVRAKHMLDSEDDVVFFSMYRTPERETLYKWIGPVDTGSISFYKRSGDPRRFETLEDAKKADVIACRHAGIVPDLLLAWGFANLDRSATSSSQVYKKLFYGRVDLAVSDTDLGVKHELKMMGAPLDSFEKTPVMILEADLYIAFSKNFPEAIYDEWKKAFDAMRQDGTLAEISRRHHSGD